jgi:hypothetical protein
MHVVSFPNGAAAITGGILPPNFSASQRVGGGNLSRSDKPTMYGI